MKVCFSIYGNDVNKCTIIDKSWTISFAVYTSFHFKDISKRGSFVFFSVNLYNTCMVLCFQVWPTVCWPLCHPGTDSSLPSSPSSFTFSLAPLGTSQWVRPICAVCCECVSLYPCPGLTNLLSPLPLSLSVSLWRSVPSLVSDDRLGGHQAGPRRRSGSQHHGFWRPH